MIELIVVLVILSVLAAVVVPRLTAITDRPARSAATNVAELLTAVSRREELSSKRIAVDYNIDDAVLRILEYQPPRRKGDPAYWVPDRLAPEVDLSGVTIRSITVDGVEISPEQCRIEFTQPGGRRPDVFFVFYDPSREDTWTAHLEPGTSSAIAQAVAPGTQPLRTSRALDLDAAGKDQEAW